MTVESHSIGSGGNHKVKNEDAKANGMWKQMTDEEYERELAEMRTHLDLLMELLQKSVEDQRCGWIMRKKSKWHGLQMKREHRLNAQEGEALLRAAEYEGKVLAYELEHRLFFEETDSNTNRRPIEEIAGMKDEGQPLGIVMKYGGQHEYAVIITCDEEMEFPEEMSEF